MPDSSVSDPDPHSEEDLVDVTLNVRPAIDRLRTELLAERTPEGHWVGELSPSALSTATAISAMAAVLLHGKESQRSSSARNGSIERSDDEDLRRAVEHERWRDCIRRGIDYLRIQQNEDGGFGDTDRSHSNIATSYLVLAASALAMQSTGQSLPAESRQRLQDYIHRSGEIAALRRRYGTDKTFVVPILTNLAIAGLVPWDQVPRLPFEAAVFPQSMYRMLRMPVVSYAIPALVAIGQARHFCGPKAWLPIRSMRAACVGRTMKVLRRMQPESGGYLEATPLTSFVVMSLASTGRSDHEVCHHGLRFLEESMNADGAWPIDTNLATWVTSLAIEALTSDPDDDGTWCDPSLIRWHLACQHRVRHPFTGAEPGGWGWSDLTGAVPDSDDTPAAILALDACARWMTADESLNDASKRAIADGVSWLHRLQNRDGGWPTFCRGWGKLPFDRSSNDLTAHAIRALSSSLAAESSGSSDFVSTSTANRARKFLLRNQQSDGSWLPLWFGNQDRSDESNPVYGTAKVLATVSTDLLPQESVDRACEYLVRHQNSDGGWGGGSSLTDWLDRTGQRNHAERLDSSPLSGSEDVPGADTGGISTSSMEETALAVDALVSVARMQNHLGRDPKDANGVQTRSNLGDRQVESNSIGAAGAEAVYPHYREAIIRGVEFLVAGVDRDRHRVPWPIGFYFAKLWYHEKLYPLIFALSALGKYDSLAKEQPETGWPV